MRLSELNDLQDFFRNNYNGPFNSSVFVMVYVDFWGDKESMAKDVFFISKAMVAIVNFIVKAELGVFSNYDYPAAALRAWRRQKDDDVVNYYKALLKGKTNAMIDRNDSFLYTQNHEYPLLYWLDSAPVNLADYDLNDPRWAEVTFEDDWFLPE
jgi:hypothetical protein